MLKDEALPEIMSSLVVLKRAKKLEWKNEPQQNRFKASPIQTVGNPNK